ncbi:hypothetical protein PSTT_08501 [Puccinia striiformis]|uniref:Uncharacterized protein n=1 Tax=Puccinia striiformis TaxID=27350 RepID=A0A2S4VCB8_9BASI|nr:hypothetical protein PSTT_16211 [Puccinia striiformis]POW07128.1 hypothetical protein PSTT_08501 [Puccinia striiformis]
MISRVSSVEMDVHQFKKRRKRRKLVMRNHKK